MLPRKKYYRQRAHSNPIADHCFEYPVRPEEQDWSQLFPLPPPAPANHHGTREQELPEAGQQDSANKSLDGKSAARDDPVVHFLDIGCGYGGLLVALSPLFPDKRCLGIEIRVKVCDYVQDRIRALRLSSPSSCTKEPAFQNIACIRSNAMKYLPNFFPKGSIDKMFFLFPDPHFKKQKHKWRIISQQLLSEYAFVLREGGSVYIATDVKDLFDWMVGHFDQHPLFHADPDKESDPVMPLLFDSTEEGKKVTRMGGQKFAAVFLRVPDPFR